MAIAKQDPLSNIKILGLIEAIVVPRASKHYFRRDVEIVSRSELSK